MNLKQNIKNLSERQIQDFFISIYEKNFRTKQLLDAIYKQRLGDFSEISNFPKKLREEIAKHFTLNALNLVKMADSFTERKESDRVEGIGLNCGAQKFLYELQDGQRIETVIIPAEKRNTICLSTQVGCPIACKFCASGKIPFLRNLEIAEIIDQLLISEKSSNSKISNIVFMGMGEPLLNYENLINSIKIFLKQLNFSRTKITVSTVGLVPEIFRLAKEGLRLKLAISLHATNDYKREKIIPIAKKYQLKDLLDAVKFYYNSTSVPITYEYIVFEGFNDTSEDLRRLSKIARMVNSTINIIPFNDISFTNAENLDLNLKAASTEKIVDFAERLRKLGAVANIRNSSGASIFAACGQLARYFIK